MESPVKLPPKKASSMVSRPRPVRVGFDCISHIFGTHIAAAGGDCLLIAEDAVVGAAAMRNEDGYDSMFFHEIIVPQITGYGITNVAKHGIINEPAKEYE